MVNYHLVILVHGLWGNPAHLQYMESQLTKQVKAPEGEEIIIYKTNSHAGFLTYDGVDINGKRISDEILLQTNGLNQNDNQVTKFSIVGYSLGGLISRYAIGILYSKGYFKAIEPVNFVTFCTPHVGVVNPMHRTLSAFMYNNFVPYFLAHSGNQMFLKDKVTNHKKPLLVWMSDPNSYFFKSLSRFKYKTLYANVLNDKRTCWFTASISATDPYNSIFNRSSLNLSLHYVKGYEPIVVDINQPGGYEKVTKEEHAQSKAHQSGFGKCWNWLKLFGTILVFVPLWGIYFMLNSVIQRIRLNSRVKTFFRDTSNNLYHLYDAINEDLTTHGEETIDDELTLNAQDRTDKYSLIKTFSNRIQDQQENFVESAYDVMSNNNATIGHQDENSNVPSLNLNDDQMYIITQLNTLGWKKVPVIIRNTTHTHAAAVYRFDQANFEEGKVVIEHFVSESFPTE
ncbi:putative serine esterase-domain-containing protein [Scheffersomyces xylosifermentans]|uniref:putative serine esterase-domain-containing protein n=1 Tax=Scheffersomyces xylosifermentans TaxID=1304137 RepID=UPI00315DDF48